MVMVKPAKPWETWIVEMPLSTALEWELLIVCQNAPEVRFVFRMRFTQDKCLNFISIYLLGCFLDTSIFIL